MRNEPIIETDENEGCNQCGRRIVGDGILCAECRITFGKPATQERRLMADALELGVASEVYPDDDPDADRLYELLSWAGIKRSA